MLELTAVAVIVAAVAGLAAVITRSMKGIDQ